MMCTHRLLSTRAYCDALVLYGQIPQCPHGPIVKIDPCIFGTSTVGSEPIPVAVDPYAHLKKAWNEGKRIRIIYRGGIIGSWASKWADACYSWNYRPEDYEIESYPVPAPVDPIRFIRIGQSEIHGCVRTTKGDVSIISDSPMAAEYVFDAIREKIGREQ